MRTGPRKSGAPQPAGGEEAGVRPSNLVEAGIWVAAGLSPLVWTTRVLAEYTLPKMLALSVGALLCALGLAWAAFRRLPWARRSSLEAPILTLAAALAVSTWFSRDWRISLGGRYNSYANGLWGLSAYTAIFYSSFLALDVRARRRAAAVCVGSGLLVSLYALLQAAGMEPFLRAERLLQGRSISSLGSPVDLGAYLAIILPFGVALAAKPHRAWQKAAVLVLGAGLYTTTSRGSWIAALLGCALSGFLARRSLPDSRPLSVRSKLAVGILLALLFLGLGRRAAMRASGKSDSGRVEGWKSAWTIFRRNPWLGTGPDTFEQAFRQYRSEAFVRAVDWRHIHAYAHNDILQALATTGILGTLSYAWLLCALFLAARRACVPGAEETAAGACGALLAWFLNVKLNPVALEVLVQAALAAAIVCAQARDVDPSRPVGSPIPRFAGVLLAAAACASLYYCTRLIRADYEVKEAHRIIDVNPRESGLPHFNRALALNLCEAAYHVDMANHIGDLLGSVTDGDIRSKLLAAELALGANSVRCHPNDVNSHYAMGYAAAQGSRFGDAAMLPRAEAELAKAMELDPFFVPLIEFRMRVARARGDAGLAERLRARIQYVESIVDRTPGRG